MPEAVSFLDLEEVDEILVEDLYESMESTMEAEDGKIIPPDSKNQARGWVVTHQKLADEIERLQKEYIPFLMDRYIKPVKDKIEKHERVQELLREGLMEFLENIEETKVNFPDVATVYIQKAGEKIIYPEDEKAFAEKLGNENSKFVRKTFALDKTKIKKAYKENKKLPLDDLSIEKTDAEVRFRRAKV